jgi:hypothetical protein
MFEIPHSGTLTPAGWLVMICGIGIAAVTLHLIGKWVTGRGRR